MSFMVMSFMRLLVLVASLSLSLAYAQGNFLSAWWQNFVGQRLSQQSYSYRYQQSVDMFGRLEVSVSGPEGRVTLDSSNNQVVIDHQVAAQSVQLSLSTDKTSYRIGESAIINVQLSQSAYLYLFSIGADNSVTQVFPNRFDENHFVSGGLTLSFPRNSSYHFAVQGPAGDDKVLAVASTNPKLDLSSLTILRDMTSVFPEYPGSVPNFGSELMGRLVAAAEDSGVSLQESDAATIGFSVVAPMAASPNQ